MTESQPAAIGRWRYGLHPHATEMRITALGRVYLQLGEALRLEMASVAPGGEDTIHLQYYIATELGPWALWLSCSRAEVDDLEATLKDLTPPLSDEPPKGRRR
jgi:hypothetical protein